MTSYSRRKHHSTSSGLKSLTEPYGNLKAGLRQFSATTIPKSGEVFLVIVLPEPKLSYTIQRGAQSISTKLSNVGEKKMGNEALVKLAAEAYVYGYPMVYIIKEQIKHAGGGHPSTGPARPVNVMGYTDILLGPEAVSYYLVANPINRYSIGDRTPGIQYNDDGSLDLYLQFDSPGPNKEPNWLPTPEDDFRPTLRMYQPGEAVLDGSWLPPSIKRLD
jgi:hypothetical protein